MRTAFAFLFVVSLAGCASKPSPEIVTKEVKVAVPTPCKPDLGTRPALMTKAQVYAAMAAAVTFDDRVKIITDQLLSYMQWTPVVEAGLKGCEGAPP